MAEPLTPERLAESDTEEAHQVALFSWARSPAMRKQYPELAWMFAIPNGGFRDKRTAVRLRAAGVVAGVPDICLPVKRGDCAALWIELKRPKQHDGRRAGKMRKEQTNWVIHLRSQGHGAIKAVGWDQARQIIIQYLEWK